MVGFAVKSALSPDKLGEGIDYDDGKHEWKKKDVGEHPETSVVFAHSI